MNVFSVTDDNGDELEFDFETHMLNQDEDSIATMTSEQRARRLRIKKASQGEKVLLPRPLGPVPITCANRTLRAATCCVVS